MSEASDFNRNVQFKRLQVHLENNIPLNNFNWQVSHLLEKYYSENGELFYLTRFLNTNMNAREHNLEYPLE